MNARSVGAFVFLALLLWADTGHAGWAACDSASRKASPDEQIRLYTLCITNGQINRWDIAYALRNRAYAYIRKDELDRALEDLNESLRYNPDSQATYSLRAYTYAKRMQWDLADQDLTMIVARTSRRRQANAYVNRGVMRFCHSSCTDALRDFDQALTVYSKQPYAHSLKAWVLATCADEQVRNGAEAVGLAQKALSLQDDWWSHATLAVAFAEVGQFTDSVREIDLAQTMLGSQDSVARDLSELAEQRSLYEAARPYRNQSPDAICSLDMADSDGEDTE